MYLYGLSVLTIGNSQLSLKDKFPRYYRVKGLIHSFL